MRKLAALGIVLGALTFAPAANADITSVLGGVSCTVASDGVRECGSTSPRSTSPTWDGVPIDINVAFPPVPASGPDGDFPLIIIGHGYGGSKIGFGAASSTSGMRRFTSRGFAVFSMTDRGFHESCGSAGAVTAGGSACDAGYVRLMDTRYEVRDAQFFAGELNDEGLVDGQRVGATGGSYGGGLSMALAALKDRVMLPDGTLTAWTSPTNHDPMKIAGAAPDIPWTDLANSLAPNGATLDYVADSPYDGRFGVMKLSLVNGLYVSGSLNGFYCGQAPLPTPCTNPEADVTAWKARLDLGEPYDGDPTAAGMIAEIKAHHSSYYVDNSEPPAPLMISNGFTDDLFPADEAIRFYNRTREVYPNNPISLFFGDFGHQRSANKSADSSARNAAQDAWLDFYVKGGGSAPFQGVTTYDMTCPSATPSGGPYQASSWATLSKGELRLDDAGAKTISPTGGSPLVDSTWDPVAAGGNPCTSASGADQSAAATYRLPAASGAGYTMMGSPTVIADINTPAANSEVVARLLDVDPGGQATLVDRQLFRPAAGAGRQVFQLHPSGRHFAPGHVAKLELLGKDSGGGPVNSYARPANGQGAVTVSNLELRVPVLEKPGSGVLEGGGVVRASAPKVVPAGRSLARDFAALPQGTNATFGGGKLLLKGRKILVPVHSPEAWAACHATVQVFKGGAAVAKKKKRLLIATGTLAIPGGQTQSVRLKLSKKASKTISGRGKLKTRLVLQTAEQSGTVQSTRMLRFKR